MDYFRRLRDTPVGTSLRIQHDCGQRAALKVTHAEDRYYGICFRCGERMVEYKPKPSLAERIEKRRNQQAHDAAIRDRQEPPYPMCFDYSEWDQAVITWLAQSGIGEKEARELGLYVHEPSGRLIIPIIHDGKVVHWIGRGFNREPKYLAPPKQSLPYYSMGSGDCVVLTEDYFSAYKVSKITTAWCLFGTQLDTQTEHDLLALGKPVVLMLDPDWDSPPRSRAGRRAASTIKRRLQGYLPVHDVVLRDDPKRLSKRELAEILGGLC